MNACRGMVGTARGTESLLHVARNPSRLRPVVQACGRTVRSSAILHHHYSAPNCSQLGVFICVSRMTRGVPAHSACARGWSDTVPMAAGSTLFCPLFSRNLSQLFRRSTRTSPCATTSCACVDFSSSTTCLDKQTIRLTPSPGPRTASSTRRRAGESEQVLGRRAADLHAQAFPYRVP